MKRSWLLLVGISLMLVTGCAGDLAHMITANAEMRDKVMTVISGNGALAGQMVDRLLDVDSTQTILVDRLMESGDAVQVVLARIAKDPSKIDGVLGLAVQDSGMRAHVMTLIKGMELGAAAVR